jgi:K+-sensing histidine kinase KdpD
MRPAHFRTVALDESPPGHGASVGDGSGDSQQQGQPQGQRSRKSWYSLIRWIQENTFAPQWLPEPLRHPLVGYLVATLVEGAALTLIVVVLFLVPTFEYYAIFTLMAVVIIALGWGTGPSLYATLISAMLLNYVTGTPRFSWSVSNLADGVGLMVYLAVGVSIGVLAGRSQRAHQLVTEKTRLLQAEARSRVEVERTREMLGAMVAMVEAMVQLRPTPLTADIANVSDAPDSVVAHPIIPAISPVVARRLAELTRSVLGCRRVSILAVNTATGQLDPVTEVGLHGEQEQAWWNSLSPPQRVEERYSPEIAALLYAGESALLDKQDLSERQRHILFGAQRGRIVPMRLGDELVGALLVDYLETDDDTSREDEILLTSTLARLAALVLEQDRLLHGWSEARASELALSKTQAQMDTFLGIASHELKTPLTSLKLSLELTLRRLRKLTGGVTIGAHGDLTLIGSTLQPSVELLSRTSLQMERLQRLVDDLVDVSRIQAGKLELRPSHADLVTIVGAVVEEQEQVVPERIIHFQRPADLSAPIYADMGRIEQVLTNYLTNALKYSPADQPVDVGVEVQRQQVRVWVRDHGPGIPLEEQQHIWERFHRVNTIKAQTGSGVGLGLGLFISHMIIERHQGQVGIESAPGHGSTFWFTLPMQSPREEKL